MAFYRGHKGITFDYITFRVWGFAGLDKGYRGTLLPAKERKSNGTEKGKGYGNWGFELREAIRGLGL